MLRGDFETQAVFPARAGMSRIQTPITSLEACVPRASGDEPGFSRPWVTMV